MTIHLYLIRHGLAEEYCGKDYPNDALRPLSAKGIEKLEKSLAAFFQLSVACDQIISSPYLRALQTAEIIQTIYSDIAIETHQQLIPSASTEQFIHSLSKMKLKENIILVSHEPFLSHLISKLISNHSCSIHVKKGSLIYLKMFRKYQSFEAELQWILTPKQLKLLAKKN